MKTIQLSMFTLALVGSMAIGCKSMNRTQKGAVIGAGGGGAIGAVIGRALGNTAMGAVIGAAVGGTAGAVIGKRMDKQAEEMKEILSDDAEVRREGEGIVINFKEKVLFGFDQSELTTGAQANLNKLSNILQKYPDTNIEIIGHTDAKGTIGYNKRLSMRRADAVASYLRNQNIVQTRVVTKGMGESDPVAANDADENRALNRRVEFVITANEKMKEDAKREAGQ